DSLVSPNAYTMVMLFELDDISSFRRITDWKSGTSDFGLYDYQGQLYFYPYSIGAAAVMPPGGFVQVVLTRDTNSIVNGFVDGVLQFSFADTSTNAQLGSALRFFRDDASEASAGSIARLRLY